MQEQTARRSPEATATGYALYRGVAAPRYFVIASFCSNAFIAPAMKNAGIRQVSTCAAR